MKKTSFINALLTLVYIIAVATLMQNGNRLFGQTDTFMTPVLVLLLFTLSAIVVGGLVLGKPLMLYLDGKKKEGVALFLQTAGWMVGFTVIVLVLAVLIK